MQNYSREGGFFAGSAGRIFEQSVQFVSKVHSFGIMIDHKFNIMGGEVVESGEEGQIFAYR